MGSKYEYVFERSRRESIRHARAEQRFFLFASMFERRASATFLPCDALKGA
jgi:hypothetical protein